MANHNYSKTLTDQEWEALCNNCGGCCNIEPTLVACPLYDTKNNTCSDYANRLSKIPVCVQLTEDNVMHHHSTGTLPADCNYVLHLQGKELVWPEPRQLQPFDEAPLEFKMEVWRKLRDE
jgi:uncharacterized cysteine cluster protein YcgN (CxxCxxCC family)